MRTDKVSFGYGHGPNVAKSKKSNIGDMINRGIKMLNKGLPEDKFIAGIYEKLEPTKTVAKRA